MNIPPDEVLSASLTHFVDMSNFPTLKEMTYYTLEENARYADPICIKYSKDPQFCIEQIQPEEPTEDMYRLINETAVGNSAYMAIHVEDFNLRLKYISRYHDIIKYLKAQHNFCTIL